MKTRTITRKDGTAITVKAHDNRGLRKRCECSRRAWPTCAHVYHFNFKWRETHYRFPLDEAHCGIFATDRETAKAQADRLRTAIRAGEWPPKPAASAATPGDLTFQQFGALWVERVRDPLVTSKALESTANDLGILGRLNAVTVGPGATLGARPLGRITEDDLEVAFAALSAGRAVSTANKYRQVLMHLQRFGVKKGYLPRLWLSEDTDVKRRKGAKRTRRVSQDEEKKLLKVATPWLRNLITAALESLCRKGELLGLRWQDVDLEGAVLTVRAETTKTRTARKVPISTRLLAILKFLENDPAGKKHSPLRFVFGNAIGEKVADPKKAWETTVLKVHGIMPTWTAKKGLTPGCRAQLTAIDLHFHDLRHEGASRLLEAGWPIHHVQQMLGHADLKTTSIYLHASTEDLKASMTRFGTMAQRTIAAAADSEQTSAGSAVLVN